LRGLKGRHSHFAGHPSRDQAAVHQGDEQVAVIRADIGQPRTGRHMGCHALQTLGQSLFVQWLPLFSMAIRLPGPNWRAIVSSSGVHGKSG